MFMRAPNPADVATTAVATCLATRMPPELAPRPQISEPPEPRTTTWLALVSDIAPPAEGAVLVLDTLADELTLGGTILYTLADSNVVSPGITPPSTSPVHRTVWGSTAAPTPPTPSTPPNPKVGRLVCVTTNTPPVFHGELLWLEVAVAGVVRTTLAIEGPIGTVVVKHWAKWKKIEVSGSVTTAKLRPL